MSKILEGGKKRGVKEGRKEEREGREGEERRGERQERRQRRREENKNSREGMGYTLLVTLCVARICCSSP